MIKDPLTAKVLGMMFIIIPLIINATIMMSARKVGETRPMFFLVAFGPSLPFLAIGTWLIRKGYSMRDPDEDA